jgi:methionine-rich copper-binding protein CopC
MKRTALVTFLSLLATPAFAHAHLVSSSPADKAAVAPPDALTLTFSEAVELAFTKITLTAPAEVAVPLGTETLEPRGNSVSVPITGSLPAGAYSVEWSALSADGHKTSGAFSFTVK